MSLSLFAKGTLLKVGDGSSPEGFGTIGNVKSISGPGYNVTVVDVTTHSTVGNFREKMAVLIDPGKLTFTVNFNPSDTTLAFDTGILDSLQDLALVNIQLCFPPSDSGNSMLAMSGFYTGHSMSFPVDNVVEAAIEFEITGPITPGTFTP